MNVDVLVHRGLNATCFQLSIF